MCNAFIECEHCKGSGEYETWGPYAWSSEDPDDWDAGHWTTHTCFDCNGTGKLSFMEQFIRKAGMVPKPAFRGYA